MDSDHAEGSQSRNDGGRHAAHQELGAEAAAQGVKGQAVRR
ncbi:hypothetical protein [Streptomyces sp. NPDC052107]